MEITSIESFNSYYERVRQITQQVINVVPADKINWSYKEGKFTIGDLIRHIAAIERNLFAEIILGNKVKYIGCGKDIADGLENTISYFNEMHNQSMEIFQSLKNEDLNRRIKSLSQSEIKLSAFLRALIVHEIHHRSALCIYLNILGIKTPPILGLTAEEVIEISNK